MRSLVGRYVEIFLRSFKFCSDNTPEAFLENARICEMGVSYFRGFKVERPMNFQKRAPLVNIVI